MNKILRKSSVYFIMRSQRTWSCAILVTFLIYALKVDTKSSKDYVDGVRFKSIKCQGDNNTTILFKECFMRAVSRQIVTLNVNLVYLIPYTKPFFVQLIVNYRYGIIFRQVIDTHQHEWCNIMNGGDAPILISYIVKLLRKSGPSLFHTCPYEGELDFRNVTIDASQYGNHSSIFPAGTYRLDLFVTVNKTQTVKIFVTYEVKSPLKESFG